MHPPLPPCCPQGAIYRVDLADGPEEAEPTLFRRIATKGFSPDNFETKQVGCFHASCRSCWLAGAWQGKQRKRVGVTARGATLAQVFVTSKDGTQVQFFDSRVTPEDPALRSAIDAALAK